jgi:Rrf2 family nitric oxide-sensitive transcriptional repressor
MKLTTFTDYSLRVLIYLAADPDRRATIAEITAAFEISEHHLTKVVHFLGQCGWIETVRGKGGGMRLARPAAEIRIGKVVRDTEGAAMPAECFSAEQSNCAIIDCCRLKNVLAEAVKAFYGALDQYTLADITRNRQALSAVLFVQRPPKTKKAAPVALG